MGGLKRLIQSGSGSEARTARGAYGLRLVISALVLPLSAIAAAWFLWNAGAGPWDPTGMVVVGGICIAVVLIAAVDIMVILRKKDSAKGP